MRKNRKCYLFLFNEYADWEPALAIATLRKYSNFSIVTFTKDGLPVQSMGGLKIHPDTSLSEINSAHIDLLILPGGDVWSEGGNEEIAPLVQSIADRSGNIAICDSTIFLAKHGYLNRVWHTSNGPLYLSDKVASYTGEQWYEDLPCVVYDNLITANGAGMIEFAIEIFRQQNAMDEATIEKLYDLYRSGGVKNAFYQ